MRKVYSVRFIDGRDGFHNHKLVEAESVEEVISYMAGLGHQPYDISVRE